MRKLYNFNSAPIDTTNITGSFKLVNPEGDLVDKVTQLISTLSTLRPVNIMDPILDGFVDELYKVLSPLKGKALLIPNNILLTAMLTSRPYQGFEIYMSIDTSASIVDASMCLRIKAVTLIKGKDMSLIYENHNYANANQSDGVMAEAFAKASMKNNITHLRKENTMSQEDIENKILDNIKADVYGDTHNVEKIALDAIQASPDAATAARVIANVLDTSSDNDGVPGDDVPDSGSSTDPDGTDGLVKAFGATANLF